MSDDLVIRLAGVGKMYRIFSSQLDNLLDTLGLGQLWPALAVRHREFWALRGIDLEVRPGSRIGIVGRNGAGKSTLLKLITGNLPVTEGELHVRDAIHALLDAGAGFHPEFTGVENVHAALTLQGLTRREIDAASRGIAEFTELGQFLQQPLRTYSAGMQARLSFATATAVIRPKVLIIDEILGAGDAYFLSKCKERMRALVSEGATVLLVSHSLDHITGMCDEAIWIDRGRIIERGTALEVVKAYQAFLRALDDRRLQAKNRKVHSARYEPTEYDGFGDTITVQFFLDAADEGSLGVCEASLLRNGEVEDQLLVGEAQDADPTHSSFVLIDPGGWSGPVRLEGRLCRLAQFMPGVSVRPIVAFNLYSLDEASSYAVDLCYAARGPQRVTAQVFVNGVLRQRAPLADTGGRWATERLSLENFARVRSAAALAAGALEAGAATAQDAPGNDEGSPSGAPALTKRRWEGERGLRITHVRVLDRKGVERAVFSAGESLRLEITFRAERSGEFDLIPTAVLYRLDGLLVCRYVGEQGRLSLAEGESRTATLEVNPLRLGNGYYVFTVALYRVLDLRNRVEACFYDLLDRSYEFGVEGTVPMLDGVFHEPGIWTLHARGGAPRPSVGPQTPGAMS